MSSYHRISPATYDPGMPPTPSAGGDDGRDSSLRPDVPTRQARLSPGLRELHRVVLRFFISNGRAPDESDLRDGAAELGLDAAAALGQLAEADLVHTGPDGRVTVAYPFSGTNRGITVRLSGGPQVWAMCAIDALGIPQMAGRDVVITSVDPSSGRPVRVDSSGGRLSWRPWRAVVLLASNGCGTTSAESLCPLITFHASRRHASRHLKAQAGATGKVLSRAKAHDLAGEVFGGLLTGPVPDER